MLIKVQYIITILYKKNFLDAMGIEPATYVLNHNISVVLPCFIPLSQLLLKQICNYDNGRVTLVRKIQNIELYRTNVSINWLRKSPASS